jgi:hypothetical protein
MVGGAGLLYVGKKLGQEVVWHRIGSGQHGESENHQGSNKSRIGQTKLVYGCEEETPRI